jgi:hypothetical protein
LTFPPALSRQPPPPAADPVDEISDLDAFTLAIADAVKPPDPFRRLDLYDSYDSY